MTTRPRFDRIVVIFNPHSTGSAAELAAELGAELTRRLPRTTVRLRPTERAGHARELAGEAARVPRSLIVSVSGDGGYNEVVDGVMQAGDTGTVCAVMAAGNANDHRRTTREQALGDAIVAGEVRHLDLLRLTVGEGPGTVVRYAHSYIGVGLTPIVAIDLEKGARTHCGKSSRWCARSRGSARSPSPWTTAPAATSTASSSPTSPRWPSTRRSARPGDPTTAGSR
ncbi:acylglycerol kinase family protein [Pseudonocardia benzenivorans]